MDDTTVTAPSAKLQLFGFEPSPARVEVVYRPRSWRTTHALIALAAGLVLTPVVGLIPPHFPWALAAFFGGIYFAYKYWTTEYTLESFSADCPKCGAEQSIDSETKLGSPHTISCDNCQRDLMLEVDLDEAKQRRPA